MEKEMATHCVFLPRKSHWQSLSLVGYNPWGRKESAAREALIFSNALNSGEHSKVAAYCKEANVQAWQCQQTRLYE